MSVEGKLWGQTRLIESNPFTTLYRAEVRAGGYCSKHCHEHKSNLFFVESGLLVIRVYKDDVEEITSLGPGDSMTVPSGVWHRFEASSAVVVYELYWPTANGEDIIRADQGGVK